MPASRLPISLISAFSVATFFLSPYHHPRPPMEHNHSHMDTPTPQTLLQGFLEACGKLSAQIDALAKGGPNTASRTILLGLFKDLHTALQSLQSQIDRHQISDEEHRRSLTMRGVQLYNLFLGYQTLEKDLIETKEVQKCSLEEVQNLEKKRDELLQTITNLETTNKGCDTERQDLQTTLNSVRESLETEKARVSELEEKTEEHEGSIEKLCELETELREANSQLDRNLKSSKDHSAGLEAEEDRLKKALDTQTGEVNRLLSKEQNSLHQSHEALSQMKQNCKILLITHAEKLLKSLHDERQQHEEDRRQNNDALTEMDLQHKETLQKQLGEMQEEHDKQMVVEGNAHLESTDHLRSNARHLFILQSQRHGVNMEQQATWHRRSAEQLKSNARTLFVTDAKRHNAEVETHQRQHRQSLASMQANCKALLVNQTARRVNLQEQYDSLEEDSSDIRLTDEASIEQLGQDNARDQVEITRLKLELEQEKHSHQQLRGGLEAEQSRLKLELEQEKRHRQHEVHQLRDELDVEQSARAGDVDRLEVALEDQKNIHTQALEEQSLEQSLSHLVELDDIEQQWAAKNEEFSSELKSGKKQLANNFEGQRRNLESRVGEDLGFAKGKRYEQQETINDLTKGLAVAEEQIRVLQGQLKAQTRPRAETPRSRYRSREISPSRSPTFSEEPETRKRSRPPSMELGTIETTPKMRRMNQLEPQSHDEEEQSNADTSRAETEEDETALNTVEHGHTEDSPESKAEQIRSMMLLAWDYTPEEEQLVVGYLAALFYTRSQDNKKSVDSILTAIDKYSDTEGSPGPCLIGKFSKRMQKSKSEAMTRGSCLNCKGQKLCVWARLVDGVDVNDSNQTITFGGSQIRWIVKKRREKHSDPAEVRWSIDGILV